MRALITGIGGFVGGHLASLLLKEGCEVWGIDRVPAAVDVARSAKAIELGDVCDSSFTNRVMRAALPTHVFHLAWDFDTAETVGQKQQRERKGAGDQNPPENAATIDRNVLALSVLLEAIGESHCNARLLVAGSSAVYGAPGHQPIDEETPVKPTTPYGVNKAAVEEVARTIHGMGLAIVVTRTFNLVGPGMPRRLFAGSLAAQLVAAERGGPRTIEVGRLDSSRDYLDVRDAARAYMTVATEPRLDQWVFNLCSGESHNGHELANEMLALARVPVTLVHDGSRAQSGDVDYQQGSAERFRLATGWTPTISFSESVRDTLEHARKLAG